MWNVSRCPAQRTAQLRLTWDFTWSRVPGDAWRNQDGVMGLIRGDPLRRRARVSRADHCRQSDRGGDPRGFFISERRREIRAQRVCPGISRALALGLWPEPPAWGGLEVRVKGWRVSSEPNLSWLRPIDVAASAVCPVSCQQWCLQPWEVRHVGKEQDWP